MGGTKKYRESGGFDIQTYRQIGTTYNGIKVLEKINDRSNNTPMHSNTPYTMYASYDADKGFIKQVSVYGGKDGRLKIKDIDIGHEHVNKDGTRFGENDIHVQLYEGTTRNSGNARKPSKKERRLIMMARYKWRR